jgi:uncharacterized membrane protein
MSGNSALVTLHLLVIALGIGFSTSNFINTRLALVQGPEFAKGLALQRRAIARFGDGAIALIWITGVALWWMRGFGGTGAVFHVKLLFVVLLTVLHGFGRGLGERMRREGNMSALPKLSVMIGGVALSAMAALVCAVAAFRG